MRLAFPWLFLLFPALELWVLIQVGKSIGALATVALVALSTMAGLALLRLRGFHVARGMQAELAAGRIPSNSIADTFCLMAAGCLFLFPGFVSDILAILLLIPFVRHALLSLFAARMKARGFQAQTVHFESRTDGSGTAWTCSTFGGYDTQSRQEPRGNAVIIDCEPEEIAPKDGRGTAIPGKPENRGGKQNSSDPAEDR